jgi:alpha-beta hydrolase superfamily lysophospholipase
MRAMGQWLGRLIALLLCAIGLGVAALWLFGAREPVDLAAGFEPRRFGEGVQVYFESIESRFDDITPGTEKRVIWRPDFYERRSPVSILYLHGFSATSEELRPVPDRLAEALDANLVYTRLAGHGRPGQALAAVTVNDWMQDVAEGLAAARAVGERVVVLSTSTGGTLAAAAAVDPALSQNVAAMIFVSPNFGINQPGDALLTWPGARLWLPWLVGPTRSFEPRTAAEATYWTASYPSVAVLPMAALVRAVRGLDVSGTTIPALFWFSLDDQVVRPERTQAVAKAWGGPATVRLVEMGPGDDPSGHVVAGAILSPGQTEAAVAGMLDWLAGVLGP